MFSPSLLRHAGVSSPFNTPLVNVRGLKRNSGDILSPGARAVLRTTKDVLYAGIRCSLEGFNLGAGLGSICLNTVSSCVELPGTWNELTSYPGWRWVNPGISESLDSTYIELGRREDPERAGVQPLEAKVSSRSLHRGRWQTGLGLPRLRVGSVSPSLQGRARMIAARPKCGPNCDVTQAHVHDQSYNSYKGPLGSCLSWRSPLVLDRIANPLRDPTRTY